MNYVISWQEKGGGRLVSREFYGDTIAGVVEFAPPVDVEASRIYIMAYEPHPTLDGAVAVRIAHQEWFVRSGTTLYISQLGLLLVYADDGVQQRIV